MMIYPIQTDEKPTNAIEPIIGSAANLRLEKELILNCSRSDLGEREIARAAEILDENLAWDYIFDAARRNGVLPLVSRNLLRNFGDKLPAAIKTKFAENFQRHTQNNLFLTLKLIEICKLLEADGIAVLPFKGPALAMKIYRNPALRQFNDLDVLVQPKHYERAIKLLTENGYRLSGNSIKRETNRFSFTRKKDVGLRSADGRVIVELHWKLSGSHFALPFEIDRLWSRLEKINLGGTELNNLPFADAFVYLCLHGARHGFERLSWICDLRELMNAEKNFVQNIDWQAIRRHAEKYGCEKVVELGIFLVRDFFGAEIEYPNIERIKNDKVFAKIALRLREKLFSPDSSTTEISDWYLYHLSLKERPADRARLHLHYLFWYLRLAFTPNARDKAAFQLPSAFYPLYFLLRPSRLLFNRFKPESAAKK